MTVEEASRSLYVTVRKKTDGLLAIECRDLPDRQPPSSSLVILLADSHPVPHDLPGDWMGYHVSHRVLDKTERDAFVAGLRR